MKKIEMMDKIEEIVEKTIELLKQINIEEDSFRKVFYDFRDNKSDELSLLSTSGLFTFSELSVSSPGLVV